MKIPLPPTYRMALPWPPGRKCYFVSEVADFPLCPQRKCYKSVITLPSMCDLGDLKMCEFLEASVFKYSIPPSQAGCVWGGEGREDLHFRPVPAPGCRLTGDGIVLPSSPGHWA